MKNLVEKLLSLSKNERGSVIVLVALSMTGMLGFVALVLDVGMMYEMRHQLQNGVDGAALAGAWELPSSPAAAIAKAREYATYNGISDAEITSVNVMSLFNTNDAVEIRAERALSLGFARVLGIDTARVEASATAIAAQVQPKALWPILLPVSDQGTAYTVLTMGPPGHEGAPRSVRATDYPPWGGNPDYIYDFTYGWDDVTGAMPTYSPPNSYSWWLDVKPGNMVNPTEDAIDYLTLMSATYDPPSCILADPYNYDPDNPPAGFIPSVECYRIRYLPLVSDASWQAAVGRSQPVEITSFVPFYLIDYTNAPKGVIEIRGVFLRDAKAIGKTIIGAPLQGLISARLWR